MIEATDAMISPFETLPHFLIGEDTAQPIEVLTQPVMRANEGDLYHGWRAGQDFIIKEWSDDSVISLEDFKRTSRIMASIEDNTLAATVYSFYEVAGKAYLVMRSYGTFPKPDEFTPRTLQRELRKPEFTFKERIDFIRQLFYIVEKLATKHIYHFDLKPENIVFHEGVWKLIDFGISQDSDQANITSTSGTPLYLAPDRFARGKIDNYRSELFSAGLLAIKALTGETLFPLGSAGEVMDAISNLDPNSPNNKEAKRLKDLINSSRLIPGSLKTEIIASFFELLQPIPQKRNPTRLLNLISKTQAELGQVKL